MIVFENPGLIDIEAALILGINAKDDSKNPIGIFGTGLKMAIAVLLRTNHTITIYRGDTPHHFTTEPLTTRGKTFSRVLCNSVPLGFTTDLGKKWELWQAFRELYCNCTDESGTAFHAHFYNPLPTQTAVTVTGSDFEAVFSRRSEFVLDSKPLHTFNGVEIHPASHGSRTIFYRGIAVSILPENETPRYTYNIISYLDLTEDRTAKYNWQVKQRIAHAIQSATDHDFIESTTRVPKGSFERGLDHSWMPETPTKQFTDTVGRLNRDCKIETNDTAIALAEKHTPLPPPKPFVPDAAQAAQLQDATLFLSGLGYDISSYPLHFVEQLGRNILGQAELGTTTITITITREAFTRGTKELAVTLLEEYIHLARNVADETRAMQETLLHEIVTLGEKFVLGKSL